MTGRQAARFRRADSGLFQGLVEGFLKGVGENGPLLSSPFGVTMRLYRVLALLGVALLAGGVTAGGQPTLRLACNDFPPHKIEAPGADGMRGFDIDIIAGALKRI